MTDQITYREFIEQQQERAVIFLTATLSRCGWDEAKAAKALAISEADLRFFIGIHEIKREAA